MKFKVLIQLVNERLRWSRVGRPGVTGADFVERGEEVCHYGIMAA